MALEARNTSARSVRNIVELVNNEEQFNQLTLEDLETRLEHLQTQWVRFGQKNALVSGETDDEELKNSCRTMQDEIEQAYLHSAGKLKRQMRIITQPPVQELNSDEETENEPVNNENYEHHDEPGQNNQIGAGNQQEQDENALEQQNPVQNVQAQAPIAPQVIYLTCKGARKIENTWGYFDGNLTHWQGFHDRFKIAVHDDNTISNSYKFLHLQESLKGKAATAFGEWSTSDDNYEEAWNRLNQMYARKYQTSHELLAKFEHLPKLEKPSGFLLQKMSNITHEVMRQLKALKYPVEHFDLIFVHALQNKLDDETKKAWELYRKSETPSVNEMLTFIEWQAKALAFTHSHEKKEQKDNKNNRKRDSFSKPEYNAKRANNDSAKPSTSGKNFEQKPCVLCKEKHRLHRCAKFLKMNLQARRKIVKENELCNNCLRPSHYSKDCFADACKRCNVKHNSLLCAENPDNRAINAVRTTTSRAKFKKENNKRNE